MSAASTLLPWLSVSAFFYSATVSGMDTGDGKIVLGAAVVIAITAVVADSSLLTTAISGVGGLLIAGLSVMYINDPLAGVDFQSSMTQEIASSAVSVEYGLYVAAIGGGIAIVGGVLELLTDDAPDRMA